MFYSRIKDVRILLYTNSKEAGGISRRMLYLFLVVEPPEDWEQVNPSRLRTPLSLRVDALPQRKWEL